MYVCMYNLYVAAMSPTYVCTSIHIYNMYNVACMYVYSHYVSYVCMYVYTIYKYIYYSCYVYLKQETADLTQQMKLVVFLLQFCVM